MPFQKIEYSFPEDENETSDLEVESSGAVEIDISGKKGADEYAETPGEAEAEAEAEEELDIEVVDDMPDNDRDRRKSTVHDITDEELQTYSNKVRKRLSHLSKVYHDERRSKESAYREREELEGLAKRHYLTKLKRVQQPNLTTQNVYIKLLMKMVIQRHWLTHKKI